MGLKGTAYSTYWTEDNQGKIALYLATLGGPWQDYGDIEWVLRAPSGFFSVSSVTGERLHLYSAGGESTRAVIPLLLLSYFKGILSYIKK